MQQLRQAVMCPHGKKTTQCSNLYSGVLLSRLMSMAFPTCSLMAKQWLATVLSQVERWNSRLREDYTQASCRFGTIVYLAEEIVLDVSPLTHLCTRLRDDHTYEIVLRI